LVTSAMARRTTSKKHLIILALGTFIVLLGSIIAAVGAFRSVMHDPKSKGPYTAGETLGSTALNYRHYVALIAYFPEIFDCRKVKDIYADPLADGELYIADIDVREAASFYCWRESGDAVWLYAFGFVVLFVFLALGFIAAFRASGQQASLAGVGLSAVFLLWCLLVIVHYQEHNNITKALDAFGDCDNFAGIAASRTAFAPWASANALVTADFGLEVYETWNPSTFGTAGANPPRAFYYSRRGGSDTFDEVTFTATTVSATIPAAPAIPVAATVATVGVTTATTTTTTGTTVTAIPVAAAVPAINVVTSHSQPDNRWWTINFNRSPARIFGPTPRRAWLCNDEWSYDGTLRVSQNLVYGGIATLALGVLLVLTAFAYFAYPILGVVKFPTTEIQQQRASNLAEDLSEDSYYGEESY